MTTRTPTEDLDPVLPSADDQVDVDDEPVAVEDTDSGRAPALGKRFFNLRTAISFALGFSIIGFLFTRVQIDVSAILDWVRQANPWLLAAATLVFYTTFPVRALRWIFLMSFTTRSSVSAMAWCTSPGSDPSTK